MNTTAVVFQGAVRGGLTLQGTATAKLLSVAKQSQAQGREPSFERVLGFFFDISAATCRYTRFYFTQGRSLAHQRLVKCLVALKYDDPRRKGKKSTIAKLFRISNSSTGFPSPGKTHSQTKVVAPHETHFI